MTNQGTKKTVMAYGEVLWDLLPDGAVLGGAPFNFAYRVNSLGDSGLIVSRVGNDELGERILARMGELGMDARFVQRDEQYPTGTVNVALDEDRNPTYTINPDVAYDRIELTDELEQTAGHLDCLCFGTLAQRSEVSRRTLQSLLEKTGSGDDTLRLLDINLRKDCYSEDSIRSSLRAADILKLNDAEATQISKMLDYGSQALPAISSRLIEEWSLGACLVTLGDQGALVTAADGTTIYEPGYRIGLVDPCGSGDAFTAGFIHLYLRDRPLDECCRMGNALGALVAKQAGATVPIATEEVRRFIDSDAERVEDPRFQDYRRDSPDVS